MSNHFHVILHINQARARSLTSLDVVQRWHQLYSGTLLSQKFERGEAQSDSQQAKLNERIEEWRDRLMSISWFMRRLNETVARLANEEDQCTGHFPPGATPIRSRIYVSTTTNHQTTTMRQAG